MSPTNSSFQWHPGGLLVTSPTRTFSGVTWYAQKELRVRSVSLSLPLGFSLICRRRGPVLALHRLLREQLEAMCEVPCPEFDAEKTFSQRQCYLCEFLGCGTLHTHLMPGLPSPSADSQSRRLWAYAHLSHASGFEFKPFIPPFTTDSYSFISRWGGHSGRSHPSSRQ